MAGTTRGAGQAAVNAAVDDPGDGEAPGAPGIAPTWCSSAKEMVGSAVRDSRVWFTVGGGILNEVYWPRIDIPQIRDLGFIVAGDGGFWVEVKRLWRHTVSTPGPGIPAVEIVHSHARFTLRLRIAPDAERDAVLIEVRLDGAADLRPYVLLAPRLGATGHDNDAHVGCHHGRRVLCAEQGPFGLALAAADRRQDDALGAASAGFVGVSDLWQDFSRNGAMTRHYAHAGPGNVALAAALPRECVLALAFGASAVAASTLAVSALLAPFASVWRRQVDDWRAWHASCGGALYDDASLPRAVRDQVALSAMVLRTHIDRTFPGAMVASLSVPWGNTRDERGGYHLVWPRDLVECAGALLALGAVGEARDTLRYLVAAQHDDGHWFQNQWLGGHAYWRGQQLDEAGFPVLLAAALAERDALDGVAVTGMVRRALAFIVRSGPASGQDRWEEDAGLNAFTMAVCIGALVCGARFLEGRDAALALLVADHWNAHIEQWTAARGSALARETGVAAHYVRVAPRDVLVEPAALGRVLPIRNLAHDPGLPAAEQVGTDFLQLVRFGLRGADDKLVVDSIKVVDRLLRADTPAGPAWRRYNHDGYGEHADGSAFDGTGIGRVWPLLTGERGHYELVAGREPLPWLEAMTAMAGDGGMLPEQVWDAQAIPERGLQPGRPTGSAMPLAWAHAEFVKLVASRALGRPFDRPSAPWERYGGRRPSPATAVWTPWAPVGRVAPGTRLLACLPASGMLHVGRDGWQGVGDVATTPDGLDLHSAVLDDGSAAEGTRIDFTWREAGGGPWAGKDYAVTVATDAGPVT